MPILMKSNHSSIFNDVAELYHRIRPRYPEQLFKDLIELSKISPDGKIFEIGAGTGIATIPLAQLGYQIDALELGPELANVARNNLAGYKNVQVIVGAFEDAELPTDTFDLVMSATAFHWLDKATRIQKSARALRKDGALAIFRYRHISGGDISFFEQVQSYYKQHAPFGKGDFHLQEVADHAIDTTDLDNSGLFHPPATRRYITEETYPRNQFLVLISTYSGVLELRESARNKLFNSIGTIIDRDFGGSIRTCYLTDLIVAQKRNN